MSRHAEPRDETMNASPVVFDRYPGGITGVPITSDNALYVCAHMRDRDREEIFATRWHDDPHLLAQEIMRWAGPMCVCWMRGGTPIALQGALPLWPGVWSVWAFGTDEWRAAIPTMTRHARTFVIPALLGAGFHRAEARAMKDHTDSRRWIEALGGKLEVELPGYGKHGEDFVCYVWRPEDVLLVS